MSSSVADYARLLREAVERVRAQAPGANDDLLRCASQAAAAVADVTRGAAALELAPINPGDNAHRAYQLQLRKVASEAPPSDLGIYCVPPSGYPIQFWYSRASWEETTANPSQEYPNYAILEDSFRWIVSDPASRLVALVTFFQQQQAT